MSPGPDFFLVTKNSFGYGRKIGIASALGITVAMMVHATYTILGLAMIIQRLPYLFATIQLLGAVYLAYLGISSLRSSFQAKKNRPGKGRGITTQKELRQRLCERFFMQSFEPQGICLFPQYFFAVHNGGNITLDRMDLRL